MRISRLHSLRNGLRAVAGFGGVLLPSTSERRKLYVNLRGRNDLGGPDRFLRNLTEVLPQYGIQVSNWSLRGCSGALVFSASWGDSFIWLCRRLSVRSVLRVDGFYVSEFYRPGGNRPLTDYQRWVNERLSADLRSFDHVVYQSVFSKEQADRYLYHRRGAYSIIHNGVDTWFLRPRRPVSRDERLTLAILGKHSREHIALALDVFKRVRSAQDALLLVVGPMRDEFRRVADYVAEYLAGDPVGRDVHCVGTVPYEGLSETLSQADIFLHVKVGDSCPNAVAEALSCGLPVVCPAWGGTKELVGAGGVAVEGPPWEVDDALRDGLAEAVLKVSGELDWFRNNARKAAVERLDRHSVAMRYMEVLGLSGQ